MNKENQQDYRCVHFAIMVHKQNTKTASQELLDFCKLHDIEVNGIHTNEVPEEAWKEHVRLNPQLGAGHAAITPTAGFQALGEILQALEKNPADRAAAARARNLAEQLAAQQHKLISAANEAMDYLQRRDLARGAEGSELFEELNEAVHQKIST